MSIKDTTVFLCVYVHDRQEFEYCLTYNLYQLYT